MPDFGLERPGDPSDTRQLVERGRTHSDEANVSGRAFLIAFAVIAAFIVLLVLLFR